MFFASQQTQILTQVETVHSDRCAGSEGPNRDRSA